MSFLEPTETRIQKELDTYLHSGGRLCDTCNEDMSWLHKLAPTPEQRAAQEKRVQEMKAAIARLSQACDGNACFVIDSIGVTQ